MNLRSVDLNLLVIFDALMTERSITRAGGRVGITPSAVSHALRRLRDTFRDELIERTPEGMVPTLRALELHKRVRVALAEISRAVDQQLHFEPATSERTFKIRINDYVTACVLPRVCARVRAEAPNSSLIVEYIGAEVDRHEEPGEIQLRVFAGPYGPDYMQRRVWRSRLVVAMRSGHPAAGERITLDRFLSLPHLMVSGASIGARAIDDALARRGVARRTAVAVPSLAAVLPIIEHTDLWTVQPEQWIKLYSDPGKIATAPFPLPEIEFTIEMIWQKADDTDAGHRWLRNVIEEEFAVLNSITRDWVKHASDRPDFIDRIPPITRQA